VHSLKSGLRGLAVLIAHQTGQPLFYAPQIKKILEEGSFDVLHYHNPSLLGAPGLFALGRGIKLYTAHAHWLLCPTHFLWRYRRELCTRKSCFLCTIHATRPPQLWRWTNLLSRMIQCLDAILCPSLSCWQRHSEAWTRPQVLHLPHFAPARPVTEVDPAAPPYFLVVGRLEKPKGIQTLFPVFATYRQAELWIAGVGGYGKDLRRMAAGNPRIKFLGQKTETELQPLYRNAIAVIVPSLCPEAFGLVVLEGFAQETPTIARPVGGLTEIIEESGGGCLYSTQEELIQAVSRLQHNAEHRRELGRTGRRALLSKWTEQIHVSRYLDIIHSSQLQRMSDPEAGSCRVGSGDARR
jgi:glycosyltransferase involved in cell wall biosynthesis